MGKWLLRDYITGFRPARIREAFKDGKWWLYVYFLFVDPVLGGFTDDMRYVLVYTAIVIPNLFCVFSGSIHCLRLSKLMYLCPMDEQTRKEYLIKTCILKMSIPIVLDGLCVAVLLVSGLSDVVSAGVVFADIVILTIYMCGFREQGADKPAAEQGSAVLCGEKRSGLVILGGSMAMISCYGIAAMLCWDDPVAWWVKWIFAAIMLLVQLPLCLCYVRGWKRAVERAVHYETAYL